MVAITFRTSGAWGPGAGANLTPAQVDGNFNALKEAVEYLEDNPPEAVSVDTISQSGNAITFHLTNGTTQGPFTLPAAAITFQGDWTATTAYVVGDIVAAGGALYIVTYAHTSEATFDPGANDGSGADYYQQILGSALPSGGITGQLLAKSSDADYAVEWVDAPAGGGGGDFVGASISRSSGATLANNSTFECDYVNWASTADWYSTSGDYVKLAVPEACLCEVGFQMAITPANSTARVIELSLETNSPKFSYPDLPRVKIHTGTASEVFVNAKTLVLLQADTVLSLKHYSSDSSSSTTSSYSSQFWIRRVSGPPALNSPWP